jgi:hypothetical protein
MHKHSTLNWVEMKDGYPGEEWRSGEYTVIDFDISEPDSYPCDAVFAYFNSTILARFLWADEDYKDFANNPDEAAKAVCALHAGGRWTPALAATYHGESRTDG